MVGVEYVRWLCAEKGVSIAKLERDLGFSNGYLNPKRRKAIPHDRAVQIAHYLDADLSRVLGYTPLEQEQSEKPMVHYIDDDASAIAQEIFKSKELRALFSVAKDSTAQDLQIAHDMLVALKRKENESQY